MQLYELVRPKCLSDVAGHDKIKAGLMRLQQSVGLQGNAWWIQGPSGCGKTTVARIIAADVAKPYATFEVDAQDVDMATLNDWQHKLEWKPMNSPGWCFLVNEAHGLSSKAIGKLNTLLESPGATRWSTWLFTTTDVGQERLFDRAEDPAPLLSRSKLMHFRLDDDTKTAFVKFVADVAARYNLNGQPLSAYWQLGHECKFNVRAMLQKVESGCMLSG